MGRGRGRRVRDINATTLPAARPAAASSVDGQPKDDGTIKVIRGNTDVLTVQLLGALNNNVVDMKKDLHALRVLIENRRDG